MKAQKRNSAGPTVAEYRDQIRDNLIMASKFLNPYHVTSRSCVIFDMIAFGKLDVTLFVSPAKHGRRIGIMTLAASSGRHTF